MIDLDDGTYTAVVDSVEDGVATVFFEDDGETVASELLDADELTESTRHADAVCTVMVRDGDVVEWTYHAGETEDRNQAAQDRFDRLSNRPPSDDDGES